MQSSSPVPMYLLAGALVTTGILVEIELVVCFCIPPFTRWQDFGNNLATLPPLFANLLSNISCDLLLLFIVIKYATSILGTPIWALLVLGCGIMHLVEKLKQLAVSNLLRIEDNLECFSVCATKLVGLVPCFQMGSRYIRPVAPEHTAR